MVLLNAMARDFEINDSPFDYKVAVRD